MPIINTYKSEPMKEGLKVCPLTINFKVKSPPNKTSEEMKERFDHEAELIVESIINTAPTGLVDALFNYIAELRDSPPETDAKEARWREVIIERAQEAYGGLDTISIDADPKISAGEDGCWVEAWLYVPCDAYLVGEE